MERTILHCDLNCFFASVELLQHPELRTLPVAVCGDPKNRHGIILAKNDPAKSRGIRTAETIWQARQKCPELLLLPPHHGLYREYSKRVNAIYRRYTDYVEPFGVDESWLDVSETIHLFGGDGRALADELRRVVREELGLTISVGVSYNKVFAKLGSDYKKPDATTVIRPEDMERIVWPLPTADLLFVGRATRRALEPHGVRTVGDLACMDPEMLEELLGKQGRQLYEYANGLDREPVARADAYTPPKSLGNGCTLPRNVTTLAELKSEIAGLADGVAAGLRHEGMLCHGLQLALRDPRFKDITRQKPLDHPTQLGREITDAAMELLSSCWKPGMPIRALTVTAQDLQPQDDPWEQETFFEEEPTPRREKQAALEGAMDTIRAKYGTSAISLSSAAKKGRTEKGQPPRSGS